MPINYSDFDFRFSSHNEKKKQGHRGRRYFSNFHIPSKEIPDETFLFDTKDLFESKADDENDADDEESKREKLYRIYYAEIIKLVFLDNDGPKLTKLTEEEVDKNILEAANGYVILSNTFYEVSNYFVGTCLHANKVLLSDNMMTYL